MADKFQSILQKYWGYPDFRGIQRNIIESIASGRDTLGLMPTGGGKSITFQVPALAQEGVCIVITPLIALMKDQVQHLREHGILADAIYADKSRSEILQTLDNAIFGGVKILYVSPERLASEMFQTKLRHIHVSFITVDEAHCISQWGYDFRPSYLQIASIREMKPGIPILALTATATPEVVDDIQERLHFKEKNVFKMSFERKNLAYVVREAEDKQGEMIHILQSVGGSAIVYARSRKRTKEMAQLLSQQGITATFYHAGLDPDVKDQRQKAWQKDEVRVMCATNAFGMGIDKPDVRVVIHIDCPDSLEAYFQEAGRAGRDGQKSYAVLLYNKHDELKLCKRVDDTFPPKELIQDIYEHLAYFYQIGVGSGQGKTFEFDIEKFCVTYKYFPTKVDAALRILERSGYLHYEDNPDGKARVMFLLGRNDLYQLDQLAPSQDAVVTALLRSYGSLFVDLTYIDETMIARQAELTIQQVYFALKSLAARHIIQFIPRRKIPFISYTRDRVDGDKVVIPKEVWESRREQYEKRIKSMIRYAKNDEVCRSRQLLAYFGEENDRDCKQCDVCLADQTEEREKELRRKVAENQIIIEDHHIIEKKD
ncbi:RecQ family ATP-dependent DNA helicase [Prevotella copri]|uniref:RecQ family ATP-dependent DNA helicase n=1 Tax=Segatella copri TaxID=165179 RepID=UPI001C3901AD|nr:ATP-dependent DNA helicase RecQ [Segatella copri]MBV3428865.1 RecQ family ATP-dependent DNA helicase [Segatella copri]